MDERVLDGMWSLALLKDVLMKSTPHVTRAYASALLSAPSCVSFASSICVGQFSYQGAVFWFRGDCC